MSNSATTSPARQRTDLASRLAGVRAVIDDEGWNAALILDLTDIRYLTGMATTNAAMLITRTEAFILTDFRYVNEANALGDAYRVEAISQALFPALGREIGSWAGAGTIGYEPSALTHRAFLQLTADLDEQVMLRASDGIVSKLRMVKDDSEIDAIRRAAVLLDDAYAMLVEHGIRGRTETEVVWMIERFMREQGAEGMSFDAIVATGVGGAEPHHTANDAVIDDGHLVTIDIGAIVDGYCSDCTRTFAVGDISDELRLMYDTTLEAQLAGLEAVRPGATGAQCDEAGRAVIEHAGMGEYFGHGLGHGVGLNVHEGPTLSKAGGSVTLEPGMVVTVEPGIYRDGIGGVRIEDLVVVGEPNEILTNFTKELTNIG